VVVVAAVLLPQVAVQAAQLASRLLAEQVVAQPDSHQGHPVLVAQVLLEWRLSQLTSNQ
jgi:hypothetical protein